MEKKDFRIKSVQNKHFVQHKIYLPGGGVHWYNHKDFKGVGYEKIEYAICAVNRYVDIVKKKSFSESSAEYTYFD